MVFVNAAFAQKGIINGVISDKGSGEKIPFASVVLLKNNQATSYGTIFG